MATSFNAHEWKTSRSKSIRLGQGQGQSHSSNRKWLMLWRRITRPNNTESPLPATYDPLSYLQNFDDGAPINVEPDNLYRSFSARYADPSRFDRIKSLIDA